MSEILYNLYNIRQILCQVLYIYTLHGWPIIDKLKLSNSRYIKHLKRLI